MPITNYYVASDGTGSVTAIRDEDGNVLERRSYDAFGDTSCMLLDGTPVAISLTGVNVGFQGRVRDQVASLYQMGNRWYNPALGRWLSRDPIGLDGGLNSLTALGNSKKTLRSPMRASILPIPFLRYTVTWSHVNHFKNGSLIKHDKAKREYTEE